MQLKDGFGELGGNDLNPYGKWHYAVRTDDDCKRLRLIVRD